MTGDTSVDAQPTELPALSGRGWRALLRIVLAAHAAATAEVASPDDDAVKAA